MGLPSVNISFIEKATKSVARSERGIVALILKETNLPEKNPLAVLDVTDIPGTLNEANQEQIKLALMGYINSPKKVICYFVTDNETVDYSPAFNYFEVNRFDYLAIPTVKTDSKVEDVVTWIKSQRAGGKKCKAVLPNVTADSEGIINYTTANVNDGKKLYTTEQYCSRIAGLIAGTPLTIACTYAPLTELIDCSKLTKAEMDAAIDSGKFIVFNDGEKIKVGRGINSLTTTTKDKGNQFKKIKIVECIDMVYDDIKKTAEDSYLGKYSNSYDNKCLLISAIGGYFDQLILDGILDSASVGIDIVGQRAYLRSKGIAVEDMTDEEIKVCNTDDKVFLTATIKVRDAIEEISLPINM